MSSTVNCAMGVFRRVCRFPDVVFDSDENDGEWVGRSIRPACLAAFTSPTINEMINDMTDLLTRGYRRVPDSRRMSDRGLII